MSNVNDPRAGQDNPLAGKTALGGAIREASVAERIDVTGARSVRTNRGLRTQTSGRVPRLASHLTASKAFRLPEVVVGVILVVGCALLAVLWSQSGNTTTTIVISARSITRGTAITAADLRGVQMAGSTVSMVGGANANTLLGQVALVDIGPDEPLTRSLMSTAAPLSPDEALTSMALAPGQLPPDLAANDHVRVVVMALADAAGLTHATLLDGEATVWSVVTAPDGASRIVTVRGPLTLSSEVAAASKVQLARVVGH